MSSQSAAAPAAQTAPRAPALVPVHPARRPAGAPDAPPPAAARSRAGTGVGPTERFDVRQLHRGPVAPRPVTTLAAGTRPALGAATVVGTPGAPLGCHGLTVDRSAWAAWLDGELLDLTYLEFEVLDFLVRHPGRVYSRAALLRHVWGHHVEDDPGQAGRTVDVLVTRLRRKLGPEHRFRIETVRRVGYRYRPAPADALG